MNRPPRNPGPRAGAIYRITCMPIGWSYIGMSSWDVELRWRQHEKALNAGTHHNETLQEHWRFFGAAAFEFAVVELLQSSIKQRYREAAARERHWITAYAHQGGCYTAKPRRGIELGFDLTSYGDRQNEEEQG